MEYKICGYKPEKLFHYFEDISAIPRGSRNEKAISDFLVAFAKERDLWVYQDDVYNGKRRSGGRSRGHAPGPHRHGVRQARRRRA